MKIVHLATSPLAGAVDSLSRALGQVEGVQSHFLYTGLRNINSVKFNSTAIYWTQDRDSQDEARELFRDADILHIHQSARPDAIQQMIDWGVATKTIIYQAHSPVGEGPWWVNMSDYIPLRFGRKLVVGHFHPRQFPSFEIVPNIVMNGFAGKRVEAYRQGTELRVLYSPSGSMTGRWGAKSSPQLAKAMEVLNKDKRVKLSVAKDLTPYELGIRRTLSHVTLDDLVTGSFHLVSQEGLAAGNVVLSSADPVARLSFAAAIRSEENLPIISTSDLNLVEKIEDLLRDQLLVENLREQSRSFFRRYLEPSRLVQFYIEKYS